MTTVDPMVREPAPPEDDGGAPRRRLLPLVVVGLALLVTVAAFTIRLPYVVLAPGSATPVGSLITVPSDRRYPATGEVLFTTVSLGDTRVVDALQALLDDDVELVPEERFYPPNVTGQQYRQLNLELMEASEQTAVVVALRRLGYEIEERGEGALVISVVPGTPADGRLEQGDVVVAVDGQPIRLSSDLSAAIGAHAAGDVVRLEVVDPDGTRRVEEVQLAPRDGGGAFLGVELLTKSRSFTMPFDVDIDTGRVGGPSAGLAFTLALLDVLTPGELTGGRKVAATGTIEMDGSVGEVGGVAQKTAAVRAQGIELFLVPPGEYEIAKRHAGDRLQVVRVRNLDDALTALGRVGGDLAALPAPAGAPR